MTTELAKAYEPQAAQQRCLQYWQEKGFFHSKPDPTKKPYTIVIPPPNVTGALHMGHALNNTLQDILIRWRRMQGYNALWMPGTDHAGIATQAVVERLILQQEKKTRHDLGREVLVQRIWEWKDRYEARILGQLRQLGCSCDWERTRFTLDPICARAVRQTFFAMFQKGLIYRGKRLVNWDTFLQTAVADDEIFHETVKGGFWTFRYRVVGSDEFIRFSTTRPETMLGDTAVAVHPDDPRYQHLVGKKVLIPLVNREIPIIADPILVDPKLGTGAVKVTPAHDFNDYLCGQRNRLPMINILNSDGTLNDNCGTYAGQDRYKVREQVVAAMEQLGLFEGKEDREIELAHSDRSKTPIEPYLSDQWFVKMADFAEDAMQAVRDKRVKFFPDRYAKTYLDWLGEKRDWCISRQLWWGHRIPVWSKVFASDAELQVEAKAWDAQPTKIAYQIQAESRSLHACLLTDDPELSQKLEKHGFVRSDDVLDTWFSSALWPHSTLGWPGPKLSENDPDWAEMKSYYPTSTLVTSRDIITLWVARMVITGLFNVGDVPFHDVYITPKLLDGFGETMSKSKGNGVDPLDIIARYGADALRFEIARLATETQDSRLPVFNVCPHCDELVAMKQEHLSLRTRKMSCPKCKKTFRPGGPWPSDDPELLTAKQASERFEQGRNFANKIWNAARFLLMNLEGYQPEAIRLEELPIEDRWILSRLATATESITEDLEGYHFSEAAKGLYDFIWTEFCDWYVEMAKGRLRADGKESVQRVLIGVLDGLLRLIQPTMPFVAETIWQALNEAAPVRGLPEPAQAVESSVIAAWPQYPAEWKDASIEMRMGRMQELVRAVREVRNRYNVEPRTQLDIHVRCTLEVATDFRALLPFITQLAGLGALEIGPDATKPPQAASHVTPDFEVFVSLQGLIDVATEVKRLEKQIADKRKVLQGTQAKLENASFTARAPAEVVQQQRDQVTELARQIEAMESNKRELQP